MANINTTFKYNPAVQGRLVGPATPSAATGGTAATAAPLNMTMAGPGQMNMMTTATGGQPAPTPISPLPGFSLPSLDGSQFVAQPPPVPNGLNPSQVVNDIGTSFLSLPGQNPIDAIQQIMAAFQQNQLPSAADTVMGNMDQLLSREGSYISNARRRGLELANSRGLLNSSIAAGTSQRAATEAAQPILSEMMSLNNQREAQNFARTQEAINATVGLTQQERDAAIQQARDRFQAATSLNAAREDRTFAGQQAALDRTQGVNNAMLGATLQQRRDLLASQLGREEAVLNSRLEQAMQGDRAAQEDWLNSRSFTREFNGLLSMMPINSAFNLNNTIQQFAMENPEIYTPEVISGMTNFFNRNMLSMLQQYFPDMVQGG